MHEHYIFGDSEKPADERTFEAIRNVGNTVDPMIQLTVDYPSKNANKRVPILDLEVWMDRDEEGDWQVRWSFYEKPMKNKFVIMEKSAVSNSS